MEGQIKRLPAVGVFVEEIRSISETYAASACQPSTPGVLAQVRVFLI